MHSTGPKLLSRVVPDIAIGSRLVIQCQKQYMRTGVRHVVSTACPAALTLRQLLCMIMRLCALHFWPLHAYASWSACQAT